MHQKFGLAMTTARAIHLRDAIQGILQEPTDEDDEDYVPPPEGGAGLGTAEEDPQTDSDSDQAHANHLVFPPATEPQPAATCDDFVDPACMWDPSRGNLTVAPQTSRVEGKRG